MNRYEILTGKEPPEEKKDYVMEVGVGSGDSSSVSIWSTSKLYEEQLDQFAASLGDSSVAITRMQAPAPLPVFAASPIPVGVVVQPTNLENGTMVMRTCTTDEQVQYMRRIEEAYNRARRSAAMARNYEAARAGETQQISERGRVEELFRLAEQRGAIGVDTISIAREAERVSGEPSEELNVEPSQRDSTEENNDSADSQALATMWRGRSSPIRSILWKIFPGAGL